MSRGEALTLMPLPAAVPPDSRAAAGRLAGLVMEHSAFVWRSLVRLGVPRADAEDAAQQVFLVAARRLGDIESGREAAFLFSTALRIASRARRTQQRRREVLEPRRRAARAREKSAPTLASELALLDTARRALRRGEAAALALLARHAREFPSAQLSDEAAAIRVEALASMGDRAGAHAAARRFLEAHPGSPHADRVESAAGLEASEGTVHRRNGPGD
ncbi:sigma factor [Sorangium sp. So ce375]|uniref:RNA polymerase sigma factor n=1 Tax=Sorangium sp. So ce375 TaxID=3133306 RepID=UPI003F5B609C